MSDRTDERVTAIQQAHSKALDAISSTHAPAGALLHWGDVMDKALASLAADAAETQTLREQVAAAEARAAEAELGAEQRCIKHASTSVANGDCVICDVEIAEDERDAAVADRDRLAGLLAEAYTGMQRAQFDAHDRQWSREMMDRIRAALAGREGSDRG